MSDPSASFKVTLHHGGSDETEVRRFVLPKSALSSYSILQDKLQVVFQAIRNQPFLVTWEDDEGDQITVSSDEELMIAMKEMGGEVYRLRIVIAKPGNADLNGSSNSAPVHSNVWCDVCSEEIRGFRYKCIQCPNYDLCAQCEMNQHHKEHFMIRIPEPIFWRPEFGHRLAHQMSKSARKHKGAGVCGEGRGRGHHHHSCHYYDNGSSGQRYHFPQFVQQIFRNMWEPNANQPEPQEEAAATTSTDKKGHQDEDGHVTYLKTIGETVASLLDPLGIDVNIEVETKKNKDGKSSSKEEVSVDEKMSESNEEPAKNSKDTPGTSSQLETHASDTEEKISKLEEKSSQKEKSESDNDDWTVINEDTLPKADKLVTGKESSSGNESNPTNQTSESSPQEINSGVEATAPPFAPQYPNLNFIHERQQIPNPMPQPVHSPNFHMLCPPGANVAAHYPLPIPSHISPPILPPGQMAGHAYPQQPPIPGIIQRNYHRPHIHQALAQMTSMGFNNEGGWLTSLLEAVNGDVSKAVDILQPVKK